MCNLQLRDEELPKEMQESNWFSAPSALRVYGQYLNLDKDHNGMLSKEELSRYAPTHCCVFCNNYLRVRPVYVQSHLSPDSVRSQTECLLDVSSSCLVHLLCLVKTVTYYTQAR